MRLVIGSGMEESIPTRNNLLRYLVLMVSASVLYPSPVRASEVFGKFLHDLGYRMAAARAFPTPVLPSHLASSRLSTPFRRTLVPRSLFFSLPLPATLVLPLRFLLMLKFFI